MDYYSLKMRASQQIGEGDQKREQHISGAERIVSREAVEAVCSAMARRALTHSKGDPDFINIKIEKVCERDIQILKALPVTRVDVDSWQQGLDKAFELIDEAAELKDFRKKLPELLRETLSFEYQIVAQLLEEPHPSGVFDGESNCVRL